MNAGDMSISYLGTLHRDNDWLDEGSSQIEGSSNHRVSTAILRLLRRMNTHFPHTSCHMRYHSSRKLSAYATDHLVQIPVGPADFHNVAGPLAEEETHGGLQARGRQRQEMSFSAMYG